MAKDRRDSNYDCFYIRRKLDEKNVGSSDVGSCSISSGMQ